MITPEMIIDRLNTLKYPPTIYSHEWIYGVWYCGTSWQKAIYYGQFPLTFVKRITTAFPPADLSFLHLCSGRCHIEGAINIDIHNLPEIDVVGNVEYLPFKDNKFDVCLIDPPYSEEDASRYKVKRLINSRKTMAEAKRVLRPNGWLLWLDEKYPSYRRKEWKLKGLIGIVTGFERRTRILSMWNIG
jgi:SAM-dependent methyltransferase